MTMYSKFSFASVLHLLLLFIIENSTVLCSTGCASEIDSVIILLSLNSCLCALHAFWIVTELRLCFFKAMAGISFCEIVDYVLWFPWSIDKHTIPETRPVLSSQHKKLWFQLCGEDSCFSFLVTLYLFQQLWMYSNIVKWYYNFKITFQF